MKLTMCYRICVGTWNVGGKLPPDGIDINEWLNKEDPADIYVLGLYSQIETGRAMEISKSIVLNFHALSDFAS